MALIATLQGGSALATAVAAPLGSFLGSLIGWRGAFFCIVPVAAIALIWQALSLPALPPLRQTRAGSPFRPLTEPSTLLGMAAVAVFFMGQFALFTYLRPFLEAVTHVDVSSLSFILLGIGVFGLIGTIVVGPLLSRSLFGVLISCRVVNNVDVSPRAVARTAADAYCGQAHETLHLRQLRQSRPLR